MAVSTEEEGCQWAMKTAGSRGRGRGGHPGSDHTDPEPAPRPEVRTCSMHGPGVTLSAPASLQCPVLRSHPQSTCSAWVDAHTLRVTTLNTHAGQTLSKTL